MATAIRSIAGINMYAQDGKTDGSEVTKPEEPPGVVIPAEAVVVEPDVVTTEEEGVDRHPLVPTRFELQSTKNESTIVDTPDSVV